MLASRRQKYVVVTPAITITPARNIAPVLMFARGVYRIAISVVSNQIRTQIVICGCKKYKFRIRNPSGLQCVFFCNYHNRLSRLSNRIYRSLNRNREKRNRKLESNLFGLEYSFKSPPTIDG